jgi:predicted NBD/HSP70 family sugar kinase
MDPKFFRQFGALNSESLRSVNEVIVLNLIRERQPISRTELAGISGLKESTISSITKTLSEEELIYEANLGNSSGGRKPRMLRILGTRSLAIGVHVAIPQTTVALSNFSGEILIKTRFETNATPSRFLTQLIEELHSILRSAAAFGTRIDGVGFSLPGLLDRTAGKIVYASNLEWKNVDIGSAIRREFELDLLFEDNVRATGLAEIWFGDAGNIDEHHWINLIVDEGIGTAIVIDGQLYGGATFGAGQFGHVSLIPTGPVCHCGNRGCWEVYASNLATVRRYLSYSKTAETPLPSVSDIVRLAHQGNSAALRAITTTAGYLGMGIAMLVNAFNPGLILLDGEIGLAWPLIEAEIWRAIRARALATNYEHLRMRTSTLTEDPSLLGAISLVLCRRFMLPTRNVAEGALDIPTFSSHQAVVAPPPVADLE